MKFFKQEQLNFIITQVTIVTYLLTNTSFSHWT